MLDIFHVVKLLPADSPVLQIKAGTAHVKLQHITIVRDGLVKQQPDGIDRWQLVRVVHHFYFREFLCRRHDMVLLQGQFRLHPFHKVFLHGIIKTVLFGYHQCLVNSKIQFRLPLDGIPNLGKEIADAIGTKVAESLDV